MITYSLLGKYGRLGNQMFQIASTIGIAVKNNTDYAFPNWLYSNFMIKSLPTTNRRFTQFKEPHHHYADLTINNVDLVGYFQSDKYFKHCWDEVKPYFTLKPELVNSLLDKHPYISEYTSLNIRRGDYVDLQHIHPLIPLEYYYRAMEEIGGKFAVFSDDKPFIKKHFPNCLIIEEADIFELFLISMCKNHIMANSTFSWWGTYLNSSKEAKVIRPENMFAGELLKLDTKDFWLPEWKILKL